MVQTFIAKLTKPDLNGEIRAVVKSRALADAKAGQEGFTGGPVGAKRRKRSPKSDLTKRRKSEIVTSSCWR